MAQKSGGTLTMVVQPEPPTLAPYLSHGRAIGLIATKIYEGLLEYDFDLNPRPGLAESWEVSDNGKTLAFKIRAGVRFHDGKPLTSADVRFSIMEVLKKLHPRGPDVFRELFAIETPDDHTAIFRLTNPAPYLIRALSAFDAPILPRHHFEAADPRTSPLAAKPVGTGPFRFIEWKKGQYIRLERNPDYWRPGLPRLDAIVVRFIPESSSRLAAVKAGKIDFTTLDAIPRAEHARLRKRPGLVIDSRGFAAFNAMAVLVLDSGRPPFDNPKVRQAVGYALDRQAMVESCFIGLGKAATGAISSNFEALGLYTSKVRDYAADDRLEAARRLLDEAGAKPGVDGLRFSIVHDVAPLGEEWHCLAEEVRRALGQIGIGVEVRREDLAAWLKRVSSDRDFTMTSSLVQQSVDPVFGLRELSTASGSRPGPLSRDGGANLEKLLERGAREPDATGRAAIYAEIQRILAEDLPAIPLVELHYASLYRKSVKDAIIGGLGAFGSFAEAWLDR